MAKSETRSRRSSKAAPEKATRKPRGPAWKRRPEYVAGYTFEQERADRVVAFVQQFVTMTSGRKFAGKPMKLMPWQVHDIIEPIYGWVDDQGLRRYRRAAIFVSKKNGKSSLMAALVLYHLLADGEPGAAVFGAAVDRIQAGVIYRSVAASVRANPELARALEVIDSRSTIVHKPTASRYTCLAADSWRAEGIDASAVVVDELHAHRKPDLVQALTYAGAARAQPLVVAISTAGESRNGIGYQWYQDARLVEASPEANPTFFGKIYEAKEDDARGVESPEVWRDANPSLGETISEKDFATDNADSLTIGTKRTSFLRYRLGIWAQADARWFHGDDWAKCGREPLEPLAGRPCWVGVDLASNLDMTSAAFVFKEADGSYSVEWKYWVPSETVGDRVREGIPYDTWIREGWVTVTDGHRLDHEAVARDIVAYGESHEIRGVGVDPWQAGALETLIQREGIEVKSVAQRTAYLNAPCKLLEALVVEGRLRHGGNPVAAFNANNVCVYTDPTGMIKPDKAKSSEKIDGIAALVNALALASTDDAETGSADDWKIQVL
ncbi:MAG: terminase large subunit [Planctomycetia bacterium]